MNWRVFSEAHALEWLRTWMRSQVATVPLDIELCEFGCDKAECSADELRCCVRRLEYVASSTGCADHECGEWETKRQA